VACQPSICPFAVPSLQRPPESQSKGVGRGWGEPMLAAGARKPSLERRTTLVGQRPPACKSGPTSVCLPRSSHALASGRAPSDARIAAFCRADFESAERLSHTTAALCPSLSLTGPRAHRRPHDAGRGACEVAFRSQGGRIHCGPDEPRLRPSWRLSSLSDAAFVHFNRSSVGSRHWYSSPLYSPRLHLYVAVILRRL
jgi:hypothetical protein